MAEPLDFELIAGMLDAYVESIKEHGGTMLDRWHYVPQVEGAAEDLRAFALSASPAPAEPVQQDTRDEAVAWMVKWYGSDGHEFVNASASKLVAQQHALRVGGTVIDLYATPQSAQQDTKGEMDAVYAAFGIGSQARSMSTLMVNIGNALRRSDCLSAIERDFFMVPTEPEEEDDGMPGEDCLLNWGHDPAEYVTAFREALKTLATPHPVQPEEAVARDASRWRRLVNASEIPFPIATIAEDPENDCTLIFGRKRLEDFIDRCDEISDNYFSRQQDAGGAKG